MCLSSGYADLSAFPHLAEIFTGDPIIITAWQFVDKGKHLILGANEL